MPKGGIRPRSSDGSLAHLLQPKWKSGQTRTIRVPVVLAQELLDIAHKLDEGESLELTQDNGNKGEVQHKAIALLKEAITPKAKGGSYAANNATGMRRLVEQALAVLTGTES